MIRFMKRFRDLTRHSDKRFETAKNYYQYVCSKKKRVDAPTEFSSMTWTEIIELMVERQLEKLPEHKRAAARASWERTNREDEE